MLEFNVNLLAVLVSVIVSMILGFLWYGPVFGKKWLKLMGWSPKQIAEAKKKGMAGGMFVGFLSTLVMVYVLGMFVNLAGATTFGMGVVVGFWVWLGFYATSMLGSVLWEMKPLNLYFLNVVYNLVNVVVIAGILAMWA